ncbi:hypothetical protein T552_00206 [Pneumocystis carinii B80]|uniref:SART-1 protein n=1 Tax=Pneumocystis carinii (strain B80) TaxID=1408658 RepID=A0A0W4ZTA0_PNEC8|nr:hypothetical protein T552_00206 [Pneumocystis carinii B80]KTW31568.1 hypothetical protein T552_00206 [Pneumocystis carinii B80]
MAESSVKEGFTGESMTVEETNALRRSLGLAPLSETVEPVEDPAVANFKAFRAAKIKEEETRSIQERIRMAKETRETQRRFTGKGLGEASDDGDLDLRSWIMNHRKRNFSHATDKDNTVNSNSEKKQKKNEKEEYTSDQLEGIKVSHDFTDINEGEAMVLTLKDSTILENEDQGDELENIGLVEKEKLEKNLENKKKFVYTGYDDDEFSEDNPKTILFQYDEKVKKGFIIGNAFKEPQEEVWKKGLQETFSLNHTSVENTSSDYQDISQIVIKKTKKKANRMRKVDHDLIGESIDTKNIVRNSDNIASHKDLNFDNVSFVDDDDLQACLARQREASKRKKVSHPENVAKLVKEQILEESKEDGDKNNEGLIIDETTEFVRGIQATESREKPKVFENIEYIQNLETREIVDENSEDETKESPYDEPDNYTKKISTTGIEDEADISSGVGAVFNLLKQKGIINKQTDEALSVQKAQHEHSLFLAEQKKLKKRLEEEAKYRKEMDRCSGKLDRMTPRERELYLQSENQRHAMIEARELQKLFSKWTPVIQLKYNDEFGREIKDKEAYKFLSHQFHGKGSGKAKVDERLRKLAEEKKKEQQSIFSYNK